MNPEDLTELAKQIYVHKVAIELDWDKQKIAREAIESAKQFFLALQSEKEGSAYPSGMQQQQSQPTATATPSTSQSWTISSTGNLVEHKTTGNQMAAGRGMVRQRHAGLEMG